MTATERLKYAAKNVVAHGLYYAGVLRVWQAVAMRRKAVVLMYHRVLTEGERRRAGSHPGLVVDRETFAMHAAVLKRRFRVLSLAEFADRMTRRESFPDSSCLITFDDGWEDNATNALPVLRSHRLPALVFLPVNFIGRRRLFGREALSHLLSLTVRAVREAPSQRARFAALLEPVGLGSVFDVADNDPREGVIRAMGDQPLPQAMASLVPTLVAALGVQLDTLTSEDRLMDWEQVTAMSAAGVAFGGHGAEHSLLDHIPLEEARRDIARCKQIMDERLAEPAISFSYPNGNWNRDVADAVGQAGFSLAFTTQPGFVSCDDAKFAIRRINIHEGSTSTTPMFLATLVGLF